MPIKYRTFLIAALLFAATACAQDHDVVIENGCVMDPETGFDQVANVGIDDGVITTITTDNRAHGSDQNKLQNKN